jgi:hypothetical protein
LMPRIYARWIDRWENRLANRDSNRVVRPFDWGLEWLGIPPNGDPARAIREYAARSVGHSDAFFAYRSPSDFRLEGGHLTFTSPLETPHPENNTVHAEFFPCRRAGGRALVVLPQWNADEQGHLGLCRLLNGFGVAALRMSLAYHDRRRPAELQRADYHVSSNVGRTIHAGRQSVIDARACLDWLESRGYHRLGILGTSLGSCIAFIAAMHDARLRVAIYNHVSTWFGDVVWTGISTGHVRRGFGDSITQDELRDCWAPISPASYFDRIAGRDVKTLLIWARYDTTFLPRYSRQVLDAFRSRGIPHQVLSLPCAHYTTGQSPFKYIDGFAMARFAAKSL